MSESQPQPVFKGGDRVRLLIDIWDDGQDHHPPGYIARKDEVLIVRGVDDDGKQWPVRISHEYITDNYLRVGFDEIEATQ